MSGDAGNGCRPAPVRTPKRRPGMAWAAEDQIQTGAL